VQIANHQQLDAAKRQRPVAVTPQYFINAIQYFVRFILKLIIDIQTYKADDPNR
jgi:hypothetical protein